MGVHERIGQMPDGSRKIRLQVYEEMRTGANLSGVIERHRYRLKDVEAATGREIKARLQVFVEGVRDELATTSENRIQLPGLSNLELHLGDFSLRSGLNPQLCPMSDRLWFEHWGDIQRGIEVALFKGRGG